jgi:uncharacterized protein (TIGR03083 family)
MQKKDVLHQLRAARQKLLDALEGLPQDAMLRPGAMGMWSVKDILAHLTAWESELVTALSKLDPRQMPAILKIDDIDEWNEDQYHTAAPRPLSDVLVDFHGVHRHLLRAVEALDDKTLGDPRRFRWMEGEPLSYLVLENAILHEQEHAENIREWREGIQDPHAE